MYVLVEVSNNIYSGNVAFDARKGVFVIDDVHQGAALYRLDTGARGHTYVVETTKPPRPRQVRFAEECSVIVSTSDHGVVYVFDCRKGEVLDKSKSGNDRVQAVTVSRFAYISFGKLC